MASALREALSTLAQVVRHANVEYVNVLPNVSFLLMSLFRPSAMQAKVRDVYRNSLEAMTTKQAEFFVARQVTALQQNVALVQHPLEFLLGPLFGTPSVL